MTRLPLDALLRPAEESEVKGQVALVIGSGAVRGTSGGDFPAKAAAARRQAAKGGAMGAVVRIEDGSLAQHRRRCHRARPAARRHARTRRRKYRCEAAKARSLAGSRLTAPAAVTMTVAETVTMGRDCNHDCDSVT